MPIKSENKARYPKDWKEISRRIREDRAGNRCEECKVPNHAIVLRGFYNGQPVYQNDDGFIFNANTGEPIGGDYLGEVDQTGKRPMVKIILTTAHLDHIPENVEDDNLRAWCQRCHNRYDRDHRSQTRKKTRSKKQPELNFTP